MTDSKKKSLVEIASGKLISLTIGYFANMLVLPLFGIPNDAYGVFLSMSALFVTIAGVRSFLWRRLFNHLGDGFLK